VLPFAFVVHGAAAVLIILVVLVIVVLGAISLLRLTARGAKKVAEEAKDRSAD
jgi:uncharacterized membrane protein